MDMHRTLDQKYQQKCMEQQQQSTFFSSAYGKWFRKDHILTQIKVQLKDGNHAMYLFWTERYETRNQE